LAILSSVHDRTPEERTAIMKQVEQSRCFGPAAAVTSALERPLSAPFRCASPDQARR
jgi:hypothetical protein